MKTKQKYRVTLVFDLSRGMVVDHRRVRRTTTRPHRMIQRAASYGFWFRLAFIPAHRLVEASFEKVATK